MTPDWVTRKEAAEMLGVSEGSVLRVLDQYELNWTEIDDSEYPSRRYRYTAVERAVSARRLVKNAGWKASCAPPNYSYPSPSPLPPPSLGRDTSWLSTKDAADLAGIGYMAFSGHRVGKGSCQTRSSLKHPHCVSRTGRGRSGVQWWYTDRDEVINFGLMWKTKDPDHLSLGYSCERSGLAWRHIKDALGDPPYSADAVDGLVASLRRSIEDLVYIKSIADRCKSSVLAIRTSALYKVIPHVVDPWDHKARMYTREDADAFVEAWTTRDADSIVYFLRPVPPADEYVKVGVTTKGRLTNRVHDIQIGIPHDLEVEATISGDKRLEFQIHKYLKKAKKHKRGEWFELSRDDVQRVVAKFERRDK